MTLSNHIKDKSVKTPLVSICCLVYNQEKHVRQSLESLLMQRTSFQYEIILHDDASTDSTRKIVEEYSLKFPDIIKPILQKQNKYSVYGINYLYKNVTSASTAKYIAMCAGDDYWIDPLKLQKQVDFLELNSDYGLVHTRTAKFYESKGYLMGTHGARVDDIEDLLTECSIAAMTVCLRSDLLRKYQDEVRPEEHTDWTTEDFPTWIWFMRHSKFKFLEDYTAVYRVHLGSISHVKDDSKRLHFSEGVYAVVDYYLMKYKDIKNSEKIRARYFSNLISIYFLTRHWSGIRQSAKVFYNAKDWFNLIWIALTLPFYYSQFMIKVSYRVRNMFFSLFNIYPIRK
jgi:glycosyltransferase involved in cell wall biosynthesis